MRPATLVLFLFVACDKTTIKHQESATPPAPTRPTGDGGALTTFGKIHQLAITLPDGCARTDRDESTSERRFEWIEVRCEAGDIDTEVGVQFATETFPTLDDYLTLDQRERNDRGLERKDLVKSEKLADGWLAVFTFADRQDYLIECSRVIANREIGCGATQVPAGEVDRVIAICKSVQFDRARP